MTGDEQHIDDNSTSPLETVARTVPDSVRRILSVVSNESALGLLLVIDRRGPIAVSDIMDLSDLCESDINGLLSEFRAARLVEQEQLSIVGIPGYETTELASEGLSILCDPDHDSDPARADSD
jgi:hypothetical protein